LARYQAIAEEVAAFVKQTHLSESEKLNLLDVGLGSGRTMRFIDGMGTSDCIRFFGIDKTPAEMGRVYSPERWVLKIADLDAVGIPFETAKFDIVICEQVLEHLVNPSFALQEMCRVLRPAGLLLLGVPIYATGFLWARKYLVPLLDRAVGMSRSHNQIFSYNSFLRLLDNAACVHIREIRGFRTVSGGPLRPLEDFSWWYKLNRSLGKAAPRLCPEIQVVATRNGTPY
jgi:SAM-dependent methyltransferase